VHWRTSGARSQPEDILRATDHQVNGALQSLAFVEAVLGNQVALIHADQAFDESGALREERDAKAVRSLARELVEITARLKS